MNQKFWSDRHGTWNMKLPTNMPVNQIAMLQATIEEAWKDYDGDPFNTEEFWTYLTMGEAVSKAEVEDRLQKAKASVTEGDVPRETLRYQVDAVYRVNGGALRTAQRTVDAYDWGNAIEQVRHEIEAAMPLDKVTFGPFSGGPVADGSPVVTDVPRETSQEGGA